MSKSFVFHSSVFSFGRAALLLMLFLPMAFAMANVPVLEVSCQEPAPAVSSQTAGSVGFSWNAINGAAGYNVKYTRAGDSYESGVQFVTSASISFSGLPEGTYRFHFQTVCDGGTSGWIITEDLIMF